MFKVRICLAALSATFLTSHLYAGSEEQLYWSRGFPGETDAGKIEFAKASRPRLVETEKDENIDAILVRECGVLSTSIKSFFHGEIMRLNGIQDPKMILPSKYVLAIPFCHKLEHNEKIRIQPGDTPEKILKEYSGIFGPKSIKAFVRLNSPPGGTETSEFVESFSSRLRVGTIRTLPYSTERRILRLAADQPEPERLIRDNPPRDLQLEAALGTLERIFIRPVPPDPLAFEYADETTLESSRPSRECSSENAISALGFSAAQLFDRITIEVKSAKPDGSNIKPAVVGIIDSGLETIGEGVFQKNLFSRNSTEAIRGSNNKKDDDGNGYKDDVWGANLYEMNGDLRHFRLDHGTQVAAVALGGVDLLETWPHSLDPLVKLAIMNFATPGGNGIQPADKLDDAVEYLRQRKASVINMSLSHKQRLSTFYIQTVTNVNEMLFIFAAGNQGQSLDSHPRYPAAFGGNSSFNNVMTVGAYDNVGKRMNTSNYGSNVDLLAPGCNVRTVDKNGTEVITEGTSFAAALVSFAGGMVSALGGISPAKIKERLIAGADMDEGLSQDAWTKARLNITKAISLSHDVIEIKKADSAGETSYLFGHIEGGEESLRIFCMENEKRSELDNISKVRPGISVEGVSKIEYWVSPKGRLAPKVCKQATDNATISITTKQGIRVVPLTEIKDIVMAFFPYSADFDPPGSGSGQLD